MKCQVLNPYDVGEVSYAPGNDNQGKEQVSTS